MSTAASYDIIGAIYDCVLEPQLWPRTLRLMSNAGDNAASSLVVDDVRAEEPSVIFEHGADQSHLRLYFQKIANMRLASSGRPHLRSVGDLATLTMLCGERETAEYDFYQKWVKPLGFRDMLGVLVLRSGRRLALVSTVRSEIQRHYGEHDVRAMEMLSPHICRALNIADVLDMRTVALARLEQTVDCLSTGIILTERSGRVSYANRAAEELLATGRSLRIAGGRLAASRPRSSEALSKALTDSLRGDVPERTGVHSLALTGEEGDRLLVSVMPLAWRDGRNPLAPMPGAAAVIVQDPSEPVHKPGQVLAKLYDLTAAEVRVLNEFAEGFTIAEIAAKLDIGQNTVKTHLQHIFGKTGTSRQAELLGLVLKSTPPLRHK